MTQERPFDLREKLCDAIQTFDSGDYKLAYEKFTELKNDEEQRAKFYLAWMLKEGKGTEKDLKIAADLVHLHGDEYIPFFETLERRLTKLSERDQIRQRALQLAGT